MDDLRLLIAKRLEDVDHLHAGAVVALNSVFPLCTTTQKCDMWRDVDQLGYLLESLTHRWDAILEANKVKTSKKE